MINLKKIYAHIAMSRLHSWLKILPSQLEKWHNRKFYQDSNLWQKSVNYLPVIKPQFLDLLHSVTAKHNDLNKYQRDGIKKLLCNLMPWRKGPFLLYGNYINSEWRSDWKWERLLPYISSLSKRIVLDVGCGNGYHLWRIIGAGARLAIGIDPMQLFLCQFEAINKLLGNNIPAYMLPLRIENLPKLEAFDTVFSMGILYHRRSPLDHIIQLRNQLVNGGELVLETLIIEGGIDTVFVPSKNYAKMRNVFFIPSALSLKNWLEKCGFVNIKMVNSSMITIHEQRRTSWMTSYSLAEFLDPINQKTVEGYPTPIRAVFIANKP